MLANWAMDLSINCMLPRDHLPDGLLIPGEQLTLPDDAASVYRPDELKQYMQLSSFIASLPTNQATEFYYGQLIEFINQNHPNMLKDPDWGKPSDQRLGNGDNDSDGSGGQGGKPGGQRGHGDDDSDGQQDGKSGGSGGSVKSGYGRLGNFDNHTTWRPNPNEAEKEYIRQRMHDIVSAAINEADNASSAGRGWGSIPAEMQALLRKLISRTVNWRAVLRQFVGTRERINKSSTMLRINRKYPYISPGSRKKRGATLYIYIDQSGSVDDEAISLLFSELDALAKKVKFKVFFFDTEVDNDYIEWRRGASHPPSRRRQGGTDFDAATKHANAHAADHDGYIIMSDGECSAPGPSVKKRAWIIVPDRELAFQTTETVVKMTRNRTKMS